MRKYIIARGANKLEREVSNIVVGTSGSLELWGETHITEIFPAGSWDRVWEDKPKP